MTVNNMATEKGNTEFVAGSYPPNLKQVDYLISCASSPLCIQLSQWVFYNQFWVSFNSLMVSHYLPNLVQAPNKADKAFHNLFLVFLSRYIPVISCTLWLNDAEFFIFLWQTRGCTTKSVAVETTNLLGVWTPVLRPVCQYNFHQALMRMKTKNEIEKKKTLRTSDPHCIVFPDFERKKLFRYKLGINNNTIDTL